MKITNNDDSEDYYKEGDEFFLSLSAVFFLFTLLICICKRLDKNVFISVCSVVGGGGWFFYRKLSLINVI